MNIARIVDVAMAIVVVGGITVAVSSPNSADLVKAFGGAFSSSLSAAMGK